MQAADAERLYAAIVDQRKRHSQDPSSRFIPSNDLVFEPTSPNETDWERILSQNTERVLLRYQKREAKLVQVCPTAQDSMRKIGVYGSGFS